MSADPLWKPIALQLLLLAFSCLFSAVESAALALEGRRSPEGGEGKPASVLFPLHDRLIGLMPSIQTGVALANIFSGAFAAAVFARPMAEAFSHLPPLSLLPASGRESLAVVLLVLFVGYLILTVGIYIPRRVSAKRPEATLRRFGGAAAFFAALLKPFSRSVSALLALALKLAGMDPSLFEGNVTEEEIRAMVDIGEEKGVIEATEKEMIENIFEFNNMTAEECMTHRTDVYAIPRSASPEEVAETIEETGLSRFPVYGKDIDDILGTLTTRDYLLNARKDPPKPWGDLIRPAYFVPESVRTDLLFREMQTRKTHMAIVVDEYGGTSGLITMEDLLEEIVGNIYDEFDPQIEQEDIALLPNGQYRVAGSVDLETLSKTLGVSLPDDEEYGTLGGLIFSQLTSIPGDGSHPQVDCFGLRIQVEEISDRRVEWALIEKISEEKPSASPAARGERDAGSGKGG